MHTSAMSLQQGSGWWKYEFCYGRKVEQYHEERDGTRISILLGQFNAEEHKKWIARVRGKRGIRLYVIR